MSDRIDILKKLKFSLIVLKYKECDIKSILVDFNNFKTLYLISVDSDTFNSYGDKVKKYSHYAITDTSKIKFREMTLKEKRELNLDYNKSMEIFDQNISNRRFKISIGEIMNIINKSERKEKLNEIEGRR